MPTPSPRTTVLLALLLQSIVGCDATGPVDPKDSAGRVVSDPSLALTSSGISAIAVSAREIEVSWGADSRADGYQLFRSTTGSNGNYALTTTTATARAYADTGLTPTTQYCYKVRSFRTPGKNTVYAGFSGPACATTLVPPVAAPSGVRAVPDSSRILITWTDNSANEDGFHVEEASSASGPWAQLANAPANATSIFAYPVPEVPACFRVTGFNAVGTSIPSGVICTALPQYPSLLSVRPLDQQSLTVKWIDNSAFEDGYEILRLNAAGVWTAIATVPANATTYRDASVTLDAVYKYRVRATKDGGYSAFSNEVSGVIPTTIPAAPTNAYAYLSGRILVDFNPAYFGMSWTDESTNEEGFRIEYSADGVAGWTQFMTTEANVTFYEEQSIELAARDGCYRVVAFNALGESQPSERACAIFENAPDGVTATVVDQQSIDVTWDDAPFETGYHILRSASIDGSVPMEWDLSANVISLHDTGLTPGVEYCYWVSVQGMSIPADSVPNVPCATPGSSQSAVQVVGGAARRSTLLVIPRTGHSRRIPGARPPVRVPMRPISERTK